MFDLSAEGVTPEEVRSRLQEQLRARLRAGAAIVTLEVTEQGFRMQSANSCRRFVPTGPRRWPEGRGKIDFHVKSIASIGTNA